MCHESTSKRLETLKLVLFCFCIRKFHFMLFQITLLIWNVFSFSLTCKGDMTRVTRCCKLYSVCPIVFTVFTSGKEWFRQSPTFLFILRSMQAIGHKHLLHLPYWKIPSRNLQTIFTFVKKVAGYVPKNIVP